MMMVVLMIDHVLETHAPFCTTHILIDMFEGVAHIYLIQNIHMAQTTLNVHLTNTIGIRVRC